MLLNNCGSVAPKSLAAFNILLFISYSCGKTIITTIGIKMQYEIIRTVQNPKPRPVKWPIVVNIIKNDAPMTTSDDTIKTLFNVSKVTLNFLFLK